MSEDAVHLIVGEDSADDPAWGAEPIFTGARELVIDWLRARSGLEPYSVVCADGRVLWARDYLAEGASTADDNV